jgi:small subunit ribosomal protein S8e
LIGGLDREGETTKTHKYRSSKTSIGLGYIMKFQGKSRRKFTGGRKLTNRGKRKYELGREAGEPHVAPTRKKTIRTRGGNAKIRLLRCDVACVTDPKSGKSSNAKIESVVDNSANLHYIRRNILTKGAIIKTDLGEARITNRPGQEGAINAILIAE